MNQNYEKYLPIGTVVRLKGGTKRVMITGFCVSAESNRNELYDYSGCIYPEGYLSSDQTCLFNHEQIEQIYFVGFVDEEEKEFKEKLNNFLKNIEKVDNNNIPENVETSVVTDNLNTESNVTVEIPSVDNNEMALDNNLEIVIPNDEETLESDSTGFPTLNKVSQDVAQNHVFIPNIVDEEVEDLSK